MASDRDTMLNTANYYAGLVASAKDSCSEASGKFLRLFPEIQNGWQGEAGSAMQTALTNLHTEVKMLYAQLGALEEDMRNYAGEIYNNWPSEKESVD